ncbi:hypothetical protein [Micromonospora sp. NPDC050495]|uniref:hypothetical protein n=1 Tax=Micromonospora sp. NPDC050495 TaxID=3154936 RepID=UPI0033D0E9DE
MSYRQVLDEAIGASPLSTIDVDGVIRRERRARRHRWAATGTAAAVAAVIAAGWMLAPGGAPRPPAPAAPTVAPVPGTLDDEIRIDRAVIDAVTRVAPAVAWVRPLGVADPDAPTPLPHPGGVDLDTRVLYQKAGRIAADRTEAVLEVQLLRDGARFFRPRTCDATALAPDLVCAESTGPAGEPVLTLERRLRQTGRDDRRSGQHDRLVRVLRSDGALVTVSLSSRTPDDALPMTVAQQQAVALDPAVALAPLPPGMVTPASPGLSTSGRSADQTRIDNAVFAALRRHVPGVRGAGGPDGTSADLRSIWTDSGGENTADAYWGQGRILVGTAAGVLSVQIWRADPGIFGNLSCGKESDVYTCAAGTGPHGERYRTVTNTGGTAERTVEVRRRDGSWLAVTLDSDQDTFPLTVAQHQAVAFDTAIALRAK